MSAPKEESTQEEGQDVMMEDKPVCNDPYCKCPAMETWGLLHLRLLLHMVEIGTMDKALHSCPRSNMCFLDARVIRT